MPARQAHDKVYPAQRLEARWNLFRSETNTLYDTLLWQPLTWPCLTLQWQPMSWQPPQHILESQHAAAQAARIEALGIDTDAEKDGSAAADTMELDETADAAVKNHSGRYAGDSNVVAMPMDYQYLVSSEQTSGEGPSHLIVWRVSLLGRLPSTFDHQSCHLTIPQAQILPAMVIPFGNQDVNCLHLMPSNTSILAACSDSPHIQLYDLSLNPPAHHHDVQQHSRSSPRSRSQSPGIRANSNHQNVDHSAASDDGGDGDLPGQPAPELTAVLGGRSAGGFALQWNPVLPGLLLAADVEGGVQLWDIQRGSSRRSNGGASEASVIEPVQALTGFSKSGINDISWHRSGTTFAAATEQGQLLLQDIRSGPVAAAQGCGFGNTSKTANLHVHRMRAGKDSEDFDCLSVDFDPAHSHRLASGGKDGYVYVLDMRMLDSYLERLPLHAGDVRQVSWSTGAPGLLASAGEDGHVLLWDVNKMKNAARQRQKQKEQQKNLAQRSTPAAEKAASSEESKGHSLGLPEPRPVQPDIWQAIKQLSVPGLLFLHHGHMAAVDQLAWNPDRPWTLASVSGAAFAANAAGEQVEVQPNTLMVWEVNRSAGLLC